MLYLFHGNNTVKTHDKAYSLAQNLLAKKPDASIFTLNTEGWHKDRLVELLQSQGLFMGNYIVCVDIRAFSADDLATVVDFAKDMKNSSHVFIILSTSVSKKTLQAFERHADKIQEYSDVAREDKRDFRLTDTLVLKDKKKLWTLYREALALGKEIEEIHGLLYWQVKNMLLVSKSKNPEEAGLKPFVFSKTKQALQKYKIEEIENLSFNMVRVYHEARQGRVDFEVGLERVLLSL